MERQTTIISFYLFLFYITTCPQVHSAISSDHRHRVGQGQGQHHHDRSVKLFVFGDSYADTGNSGKFATGSWKAPYGITFPGKPAGRFSDGRVLTDYIASFLGIRSPVPYKWRKSVMKSKLVNGINFAYGGTGVFKTLVSAPNMTTQIDFFQQLLEEKLYAKSDLDSSIALVSLAGNDYSAYFLKTGNQSQDLAAVTTSIVNQLVVNIKRINNLGVRKIGVTAIEPMGCLPGVTSIFSSYQNCSESLNSASRFHNQILHQKLEELKNVTTTKSAFVILDLYNAFLSAIQQQKKHQGNSTTLGNPLKPCCVGVSSEYSCGSVDERSGAPKYTVCSNPERSMFWDKVHPSQNGWQAVYSAIKSSLHQLVI